MPRGWQKLAATSPPDPSQATSEAFAVLVVSVQTCFNADSAECVNNFSYVLRLPDYQFLLTISVLNKFFIVSKLVSATDLQTINNLLIICSTMFCMF